MKSQSFTITTTAQKVVSSNPFAQYVYTHVVGNGTVYFGGSDVTSSNGMATEKHTAPLTFFIPRNQELWAVVAADTETLQILQEKGA